MSSVPSEVSKYMGNAVKLADIWGTLVYNVKSIPYLAKGDSSNVDTTNIQSAINAASVNGGVVVFPPGTYITGNLTIPSNVTLWFANSAKLSIASGATVTINGPISAGLNQIFTGLGAVSVLVKVEKIYPQWFGAKGDGVNDDTTAIQKAINSGNGGIVYFTLGAFVVTSTLTIAGSGTRIQGEGIYSILALPGIPSGTVIVSKVVSGPTLRSPDGLQHIEIKDITVTRTIAAVSGNNGIEFQGNSNHCRIERVEVSRHWAGLSLGSTGYSKVENCFLHDNYSDGLICQNSSTNGSMQWFIYKTLSQLNAGRGFKFQAVTNSVGFVTLGEVSGCTTYGNTAGGIAYLGLSGTPINGVRLGDCFFGEDGSHEIYLDCYGTGSHKISSVYCEISGSKTTGPDGATAISNQGNGIKITANNQSVAIDSPTIINNAWTGISTAAAVTIINGGDIRINGRVAGSGEEAGVYLQAGKLVMSGSTSRGQRFGVYLQVDAGQLVGNQLTENTQAGLAGAVTLTNTIDIGNIKV